MRNATLDGQPVRVIDKAEYDTGTGGYTYFVVMPDDTVRVVAEERLTQGETL